ncbi:MAG: DNA repair protein RadC [Defluviitaleaceae bacterium]|nr:DNA repair protein RadC [Defluviitaleaceae bacterium]
MNAKKYRHDHTGHRSRHRERYISGGSDSFHDHELLELLLYYCYPRCNTNEIAQRMIDEFGSLHQLFEADVSTLMARLNCSENVAVMLNAMPVVANRFLRSRLDKKMVLNNSKIAGAFAISQFADQSTERFFVVSLDMSSRVNKVTLVSKGTLDESAYYPREVMKAVIQNNAISVILMHNHPGGTLKPSNNDLAVTCAIIDGLEFVKVTVVDHIIVSGDKYYSFSDRKQHVAGY